MQVLWMLNTYHDNLISVQETGLFRLSYFTPIMPIIITTDTLYSNYMVTETAFVFIYSNTAPTSTAF